MKRHMSEAEKIYNRVRSFIQDMPLDILASLRVMVSDPFFVDHLRKRIKAGIGTTAIEDKKETWYYSFWYGEKELYEFIRQLI